MSEKSTSISPVTAQHLNAFYIFDAALVKALGEAKDSGVPQGLLVSILHAHNTRETLKMI